MKLLWNQHEIFAKLPWQFCDMDNVGKKFPWFCLGHGISHHLHIFDMLLSERHAHNAYDAYVTARQGIANWSHWAQILQQHFENGSHMAQLPCCVYTVYIYDICTQPLKLQDV